MAVYLSISDPVVAIVAISAHEKDFDQRALPSVLRNFMLDRQRFGRYMLRLKALIVVQVIVAAASVLVFVFGADSLAQKWLPSSYEADPFDTIVKLFMPLIFASP